MNREYTRAPHRRAPASGDEHSPHAALLIDFDNVTMGIRSNLGQEVRNLLDSDIIRGKVSVQRAYADWRRYPQYVLPLSEASIDLIYAPAYGSSKKNATDIRLAIDALELVFIRPEIGTFILLSGDSDFSSLVLKLKEYGKYIIGVGLQESSSDILVQNCDEYYSYSTISGLTSAAEMPSQRLDAWELVDHAIERMVERDDVMRSDRLKQVMLELDSSFDEKSQGFSKFNKFLAEAARRELVKLRKAENGQYELAPGSRARAIRGGGEPGGRARVSSREVTGDGGPAGTTTDGGSGGDGGRERRRSGNGGGRGRSGRASRRGGRGRSRGEREEEPARAEATAASAGPSTSDLRRAYDLLRGAVTGLAATGDPVRDSEVKRKILAEDDGFDEAALGFRKFSRFLQQAHDEGVVDLTQGDDGNYYLTVDEGGGAPSAPPSSRREEAAAPSSRREERARRLDRPGTPGRMEDSAASDESDDSTSLAAVAAASAAGRRGPTEAAETTRAPAEERPEETADGTEREAAPAEGRRGRGLGRFRRGSRAGSAGEEERPAIGPMELGDETGDAGGAAGAAAAAPTQPAAPPSGGGAGTDAPTKPAGRDAGGSRRGLGRFRRGSRGGASGGGSGGGSGPTPGPVDTGARSGSDGTSGGAAEASSSASAWAKAEPARESVAGRAADPAASTESGAGGGGASPGVQAGSREEGGFDPIDHMVRNYSGVGQRTAERLVDEFGERVFDVIDREPERVADLLSEHRARAVLEAREAERESGSAPEA